MFPQAAQTTLLCNPPNGRSDPISLTIGSARETASKPTAAEPAYASFLQLIRAAPRRPQLTAAPGAPRVKRRHHSCPHDVIRSVHRLRRRNIDLSPAQASLRIVRTKRSPPERANSIRSLGSSGLCG
jgi:hypothetical protein